MKTPEDYANDLQGHDGWSADYWNEVRDMFAAAMKDAAARALCDVLDRLGGDGVTAALNKETPEQVSDDIWELSRWLEQRARDEAAADLKAARDEIKRLHDALANEISSGLAHRIATGGEISEKEAERFLLANGIDADAAFARLKEQIAKQDEAVKVRALAPADKETP